MRNNQNGFALIEALLVIAVIVLIGFTGWYTMLRPTWESRRQLTNIMNQLKVPSSYQPMNTTFSEQNPELTTIFTLSRKYKVTTAVTREEALQQIVKTLGLNPSDHQVVNIYDEQLNGTASPLFDKTTGSRYLFSAKLEPSFDGTALLPACKDAQTDDIYRTCVNDDPKWGKKAYVSTVEIIIEKDPR